jgi:hypothetical protein
MGFLFDKLTPDSATNSFQPPGFVCTLGEKLQRFTARARITVERDLGFGG